MRDGRLPPYRMYRHGVPNFFVFGPTFSFVAAAVAVGALVIPGVGRLSAAAAQEVSETAAALEICDNSNNNAECAATSPSYVCIDSRCMCNPMWAHTGTDCTGRTWTSWAMVAVLVMVTIYKIHVLHAAAKKGLLGSTKTCSGVAELASIFFMVKRENDSGGATMRAVIGTTLLESASDVWKILTATGVVSDRMSGYWDERVFFPLAEGSYMLPSAIVISVWVDVAKASTSRSKARNRLNKKKRALEVSAASYMVFLLAVCEFGHLYLAMVINLMALALGMLACGSGSAKLCNTLRKTGGNNAEIAKKVFQVSSSMGMNFYVMLVGNAMILSSRTRKSNPANLALLGVTISSIGKCLLNKAIFEYACESARAKRERAVLAGWHRRRSTRPIADMVLSVRSLHNTVKLKAALSLQRSKAMITPVEEEDPGEHAPCHANPVGVAGGPPLPVPHAAPDKPRGKMKGREETVSPSRSTHRGDPNSSGRGGVAYNDETSWRRSSAGVPGLLGVGRRMSSALCLVDPLGQGDDEARSNAETTAPRLSVRELHGSDECISSASEN